MSITRNRELSQFGSFIHIDDSSQDIGITTESIPYVGIGTTNPTVKFHVFGDTNLEGNVSVIGGNLEASSYTLNGNPLVEVELSPWIIDDVNLYRILGDIGIGTSTLSEKLTVSGNVSAGQFISTVTSGTAPLVVLSDTQVTNLNASFLRGKVPPSGTIVGTTDSQTLTNKILSSSSIHSTGISFSGSTSGSTILAASSIASGTLTLPAITDTLVGRNNTETLTNKTLSSSRISSTGIAFSGSTSGITTLVASSVASGVVTIPAITDTLVGRNNTETLTNKTIAAGSNTITGITSSNLSSSAGILNSQLANSTISGISLGSNLNSLTFGSYLTSTGSYNGSTSRTVSVAGTSLNTANTLVARDSSGDFTAGNINCSNITASFGVNISSLTVIDNNRNLSNIESFDSTVKSIWDTVTITETGKTLVNREHCTVTAQGQTIILPANPQIGWEVVITVGNFTNTIINRNSQNIMGLAEDMTINISYAALTFIYTGASQGWRIY